MVVKEISLKFGCCFLNSKSLLEIESSSISIFTIFVFNKYINLVTAIPSCKWASFVALISVSFLIDLSNWLGFVWSMTLSILIELTNV